jgi:alanine racemase
MANAGYTTGHVATLCGAQLFGPANLEVTSLLTDSRRLIFPEGTLFFALKTASNNGHRYIAELYRQGVRAFVVNPDFKIGPYGDAAFLVCDDVRAVLQNLAAHHRATFNYPVVGITGSNGKTVVKEWLFQLIHGYWRTVRSPRSYNSQIGVPLSLWQLNGAHHVALIEAGISTRTEMARLQKMIRPQIGIFTNLGHAHDQGFNSLEEKAAEKAQLFRDSEKIIFCRDHVLIEQALLKITNGDENRLLGWSFSQRPNALFVARSGKDLSIYFTEQPTLFHLPFGDEGSIENCTHALVCAWHLGVPLADLQNAVEQLTPIEMRLQERRGSQGNLLINDFYNSDPESVRIALDLLMQQPHERNKVVVISEFEGLAEGEMAEQYQHIVAMLNTMPLKEVVCVGGAWLSYYSGLLHEKHVYLSTEELVADLPNRNWQNSAILLKGARKFQFETIAEQLQEQVHQTWLEVNLSAMAHNLRYYRTRINPQTKTMAMVKALSYGSGTVEIARWLQYNRVDYLAVAYVDEGVTLRKGGINLPILVMNPDPLAFARMIEFRLEPELYSERIVRQFLKAVEDEHTLALDYPIHLKVETGMHRLGIEEEDLDRVIGLLQMNQSVKLVSFFSHLAASDNPAHDDFTRQQIASFNTLAARIQSAFDYPILKHIANTSGVARFAEAQLDMVRLGIGLYGAANSEDEQQNLKIVSQWFTRVSQIKHIARGESVGYSRSFMADEPLTIATLPVGYADGYFRLLGNGVGHVAINGQRAPVVGRVCMDMIMVNVTGLHVAEGDVVEILGENSTALEMATAAQTIPYEIFTHISARVPRVYLTE